MKILCVVTGEALIDGKGMDWVGAGGLKGCAGYDGGSAARAGNQMFFRSVDLCYTGFIW